MSGNDPNSPIFNYKTMKFSYLGEPDRVPVSFNGSDCNTGRFEEILISEMGILLSSFTSRAFINMLKITEALIRINCLECIPEADNF